MAHTGNSISEKNSSRKLTEQARPHTPRYHISMRVYGYGFPRMSPLGSSENRSTGSPLTNSASFSDTMVLHGMGRALSGCHSSGRGVYLVSANNRAGGAGR